MHVFQKCAYINITFSQNFVVYPKFVLYWKASFPEEYREFLSTRSLYPLICFSLLFLQHGPSLLFRLSVTVCSCILLPCSFQPILIALSVAVSPLPCLPTPKWPLSLPPLLYAKHSHRMPDLHSQLWTSKLEIIAFPFQCDILAMSEFLYHSRTYLYFYYIFWGAFPSTEPGIYLLTDNLLWYN